ncbi:hypothetical protein Sango_2907900 [Sesamum angolense]|uniref:Uncharacterized protein n=1 Tax=Sesamum angolense TaxID=2727404 RepID=A0AAE1T5Q6_9LAMI|nr:hypothetical protein Sango_2907900 [Sesamum angolense]
MIRKRTRTTWVPSLNGATRCPIRSTAPKSEEERVDVKIHGKPVRAIIDTGATHNYLASAEVERLGLVLEKGVARVKAINSAAQPIAGVAKSVLIKVGPFEGKTNLSVVVMDDFKLILGLEFLRDTRTAVLPHVDSLMMLGSNLVSSLRWPGGMEREIYRPCSLRRGASGTNPPTCALFVLRKLNRRRGPSLA